MLSLILWLKVMSEDSCKSHRSSHWDRCHRQKEVWFSRSCLVLSALWRPCSSPVDGSHVLCGPASRWAQSRRGFGSPAPERLGRSTVTLFLPVFCGVLNFSGICLLALAPNLHPSSCQ